MEKEATKELVFEEKYVTAYVLHDLKCLELVWDGNLKEEDYKRIYGIYDNNYENANVSVEL